MDNMTGSLGTDQPYKPSWIDRWNSWVERQPLGAGLFYLLFGAGLVGIQLLFLRGESGWFGSDLLPVIVFNGLFTPFLLALIHFLDQQAITALTGMHPVLTTSDIKFGQYKYQLANMPARTPLLAGLIVLVLVILMEWLWIVPGRYAGLAELREFTYVFQVIDKSSAFLFGVFIYHTIRQLRLVNAIHTHHIRINLYDLAPARAFSRLTAATSVGLLAGVYGWIMINPELLADPVIIGFALVITILALSVFVWPLYGVHRSMELAKEQALRENELRFQAVFEKFNLGFQEEDFAVTDRLNGTIASLEVQQRRIRSISTWPWIPETAQIVLSATAGPLILAIIRFLIEGVLNPI